MFFQPPEEHITSSTIVINNPQPRKKKNYHKKRKDSFKRRQLKFAVTMSSWADNFATAATWQMKHQIAYWKSKARALEYENRILHDIIRKNTAARTTFKPPIDDTDSDSMKDEEFVEDDDFEVSEEFIQFLQTNAKYKEDAKRERELLKAKKIEEEKSELILGHSETRDSYTEKLKELYGKDWQRIAALEMSTQCDFIEKVDVFKPMYWPNIPLNFNFS